VPGAALEDRQVLHHVSVAVGSATPILKNRVDWMVDEYGRCIHHAHNLIDHILNRITVAHDAALV
jgi:hypothetical protein